MEVHVPALIQTRMPQESSCTDAEAAILWPPDAKGQLIRKAPNAGKIWGQDEKWETEDEVIGWHHRFNEYEFEQTPGDSGGQGSLSCCNS